MKPIKTTGTTRVLNAPPDWDAKAHGECEGLPVIDKDGFMFSYWSPSWAERFAVLFGRPVRLTVAGTSHPAVAVDTDKD